MREALLLSVQWTSFNKKDPKEYKVIFNFAFVSTEIKSKVKKLIEGPLVKMSKRLDNGYWALLRKRDKDGLF